MTVYLSNAFSLSMIQQPFCILKVVEINPETVRDILKSNFVSAIGHEATAQFLSQILGIPVQVNRIAITLKEGDELIVFQLLSRLPEGAILNNEQLAQIKYKFYKIKIADHEVEFI